MEKSRELGKKIKANRNYRIEKYSNRIKLKPWTLWGGFVLF